LQRPFGMAAPWQGLPVRLERAPHWQLKMGDRPRLLRRQMGKAKVAGLIVECKEVSQPGEFGRIETLLMQKQVDAEARFRRSGHQVLW
jgi:selenophosphate synthetase-related protein